METADSSNSLISSWTLDPGETSAGASSSLFPVYPAAAASDNLLTQLPGLATSSSEVIETALSTSASTSLWTLASNVTAAVAMSPLRSLGNATSLSIGINGTNGTSIGGGFGSVWTGGPVGGFNGVDEELEEVEMPVYLRITTLVFLLIIFVVGTVGNSMVILVIHCSKEMKTSTNIFLLNLSLADLLVLMICAPTCIAEVAYDPDVWMLGAVMCKLVSLLEVTVANVSVLTILAISFERYYAICCPLRANYVCTKTRAFAICFSTWLVAALVTSPMYLMVQYEVYVGDKARCDLMVDVFWADVYTVTSNVVFFFLPFFILLVTYTLIARNLSSDRSRVCLNHSRRNIKARQQVIMMLGTVVFTFFLCLLPFRGFTLFIVFSEHTSVVLTNRELYYNILYFSRIMLYLNSALNPILYNIMSSKFRNGFLILCSKKRRKMYRLQRRGTFHTMTTTSTASSTSNVANNFVHSAVPEMRRACSNRLRAGLPSVPALQGLVGGHQQSHHHHQHHHCCCGCPCNNGGRSRRDQLEMMDPVSSFWNAAKMKLGGGAGGYSFSMNNLHCQHCSGDQNPLAALSSWELATATGGGDKREGSMRGGAGGRKCVCYVVNGKGKNGGPVTRAGHLVGEGAYISITCPGCLKKRNEDLLFWKNDENVNKDGQKFCVRMAMKTNCYACAYSTFQEADTLETIL